MVLNLEEDNVGAVLFGDADAVKEGHEARARAASRRSTSARACWAAWSTRSACRSTARGPIAGETYEMPIERKAPGVIYREPVTEPLQTGIKAIDSMVPIGRGQRELVIGDRQTGKTAVLRRHDPEPEADARAGAASRSTASTSPSARRRRRSPRSRPRSSATARWSTRVIVNAPASTPAPLQFIAPFAGACIGEFFRDTGRHALCIYDDLSKQAVAYREVSLLLRRPPGREAYPGDVFYLHSRLLERAAKITPTTASRAT